MYLSGGGGVSSGGGANGLSLKTRRWSALHFVALLVFGFSIILLALGNTFVFFAQQPQPALPLNDFQILVILWLIPFTLVFLYLDLWAHDEDEVFNAAMLAVSIWARRFDLGCRAILYFLVAYVLAKSDFQAFGVTSSPQSLLLFDAVCVFVTLALTFCWLLYVSRHRGLEIPGATPIDTGIFVNPKSMKFLTPYYALFSCLVLVAGNFFVVSSELTWYVCLVDLLKQWRLAELPLPDQKLITPAKFAVIHFLSVFTLLLCLLAFLTRVHYWKATLWTDRSP